MDLGEKVRDFYRSLQGRGLIDERYNPENLPLLFMGFFGGALMTIYALYQLYQYLK